MQPGIINLTNFTARLHRLLCRQCLTNRRGRLIKLFLVIIWIFDFVNLLQRLERSYRALQFFLIVLRTQRVGTRSRGDDQEKRGE